MSKTPLFQWMGTMLRRALAAQAENAYVSETGAQKASKSGRNPGSLLTRSVSRREFLKGMLGAAGAVATVSLAPALPPGMAYAKPRHAPARKESMATPVIIVGGGLAGLVTAYRLMRQNIPCEIYEAGRRLGGRIFTQSNFNRDGMFVELGGELVDTGHEDLIALCAELHVPLERFETDEPGIEPAIYFSEGKARTEADVIGAFAPLAETLTRDIRKCFPDGEVQIPTYQQPYNAKWLDDMSLAQYLDAQTHVESWLIKLIKAAYVGEYGLDVDQQSALNLLLLIGIDAGDGFRMFGESDEAMRIRGGNSRLVEAVADAIQPAVPIHRGACLEHVSQKHGLIQLRFRMGQKMQSVEAERVVLALPFAVLRQVGGVFGLGLSSLKRKAIQQWGYGTNSKQMIGFRSRFWRNPKAVSPNSPTPANTGELFTDLPSQCYWETSRLQPGNAGILTNFMGGQTGKDATRNQWHQSLNDLERLYPGASAQFDDNNAFFNWSQNPYAKGSYTCPKPGQYTTLMGVAQEPELGGRLFFAGEHCSVDWAGFMNGAAQSGNIVARQIGGHMKALVEPVAALSLV